MHTDPGEVLKRGDPSPDSTPGLGKVAKDHVQAQDPLHGHRLPEGLCSWDDTGKEETSCLGTCRVRSDTWR